MSIESAEKFRQLVSEKTELQEAVKNADASDKTLDLVALGQLHGCEFTESEADEVLQAVVTDGAELSDFELEMVAGGNIMCFDT